VTFATLPWRAILVGSLIGLAAALADAYDVSGFLAHNELKAVNAQFSLRGPRAPQAPVVIVTIDEDSFVELNMPWPWPRALHAKFLDIVSRGKPAVIALDILFIELPNIYATPGSVLIDADAGQLGAVSARITDGDIVARAGAEIGILNESPFTLQVNDAVIRDTKRVVILNDQYTVLTPGNVYFKGGVWNTVEEHNPEMFRSMLARNPTGRMGTPQEVANAVVFLASPRASFITGTHLIVDGALTQRVQF